MPLDTLFTNPNPTYPRPQSIWSRFRKPATKHSRHISEFEIELQDPYQQYRPGQTVKGHVLLTPAKGFDITHLVVALHGYAKVYRNYVVPGEGAPEPDLLINGQGNSGFAYHGKGLATLFQDEVVLCGSGFLKREVYKFQFELDFPAKGLPSSIDFERGSVSYVISATITKPSTMAPTSTCFQHVKFKDDRDVLHMAAPRTRLISLQPLRRGRVKKKISQNPSVRSQPTSHPASLLRRDTGNSIASGVRSASLDPPASPVPSEDTVGTNNTASSCSYNVTQQSIQPHAGTVRSADARSTNTSSSGQTIDASIEMASHGALPGDQIPIRVTVQHTRPVKGVIIVTLFRQTRVDMHPAIPVTRKGKEKDYEEIFPKSKTGLGALQFANGDPSRLYRMDLFQNSTFMIVDPSTLTADARTSITIPPSVIPTIDNVPGDMISLRYYVEVILDLCGKLSVGRFLPSLTSHGPSFSYVANAQTGLDNEPGTSILDTSEIRRTKSIISFKFPLVVGTRDSGRDIESAGQAADIEAFDPTQYHSQPYSDEQYEWDHNDEIANQQFWYDEQQEHLQPYEHHGFDPAQTPAPPHFAPPPPLDEDLDEKTRLRRQEEFLLPSQPPQEGESSGSAQGLAPSAPFIPEDNHLDISATSRNDPLISPSGMSTRSGDTVREAPSAPTGDSAGPDDTTFGDDKQELERQRLMSRASAPPTGADEHNGVAWTDHSGPSASAPFIEEENGHASHPSDFHHATEALPVYQR